MIAGPSIYFCLHLDQSPYLRRYHWIPVGDRPDSTFFVWEIRLTQDAPNVLRAPPDRSRQPARWHSLRLCERVGGAGEHGGDQPPGPGLLRAWVLKRWKKSKDFVFFWLYFNIRLALLPLTTHLLGGSGESRARSRVEPFEHV